MPRSANVSRRAAALTLTLLVGVLCARRALAQSSLAARIAFLHISADAPAVDIYIDGGRVVSDLDFSETSAYLGLTAGTHQVVVTPASRLDVLASGAVTAQAGASFTWVLSGVVTPGDTNPPASGDQLFAHIVQLNDAAGASGITELRVVNASPGAGPLQVSVAGPMTLTLATNLGYGAVTAYAPLAAGTYTMNVYQSGASAPAESITPVPVGQGNAYTVVLGGLLPSVIPPGSAGAVRGFLPVELTDQNLARTAQLTPGCNQEIVAAPAGTSIASIVARVADVSAVASVWRYDNALKLLRAGYFADTSAPTDFSTTAASPEVLYICVSSATTWSPP